MKKVHEWNPETGTASCIIEYNNQKFGGYASCHPDDLPFISPLTGGYIAEGRANIKYYQHIKNNELYPQIKVLKHLLNTIENSKNYSPKDNMVIVKRIRKELNLKNIELEKIKNAIEAEKKNLKDYIIAKDNFHKKLGKKKQSSN